MPAWTIIAETGAEFTDFAPYVVAVADTGLVAFQAATNDGTGVYAGDGDEVHALLTSGGDITTVRSHADVDTRGDVCVYADLDDGHGAVLYKQGAGVFVVADTRGPLAHIRPAGPTMNEDRAIGFRAEFRDGHTGMFVGDVEGYTCVADTRERFSAFFGLPVVLADGSVVFRADLRGGGQGIYRSFNKRITPIVETGSVFGALANFPSVDEDGNVAFVGMLARGGGGVFLAHGERLIGLADTTDGYASFRGALIGGGDLVFFGAPRGGELGLFTGRNPTTDRLFCLGDPLFGSTVVDFAANPVSLNRHGQLGLRLRLADDRQLVVRVDLRA